MLLNQHELKIYPLEDEFIASIELNRQNPSPKAHTKVEMVVILDCSGSMGSSVSKIINNVFPKFFEFLSYDPQDEFHLIAFNDSTTLYKIKINELQDFKLDAEGGTLMAPAVTELHKLFTEFNNKKVTALRILTISDGEIWDQHETKKLGEKLEDFMSKMKVSINSQAVRLFTCREQPDTRALCSLLQLNNVEKSNLTDIRAKIDEEKIVEEMTKLFINDGFNGAKVLSCNKEIFRKLSWDENSLDKLIVLPNRKNVFWLNKIDQKFTIDGEEVKILIEKNLTIDKFHELLHSKLNFIIDRMKILKVVNTEKSKLTIEKIVQYFTKLEDKIENLPLTAEVFDLRVIENRKKMLKLNAIKSKKISTMLAKIANDDDVNKLNAAQVADYLRSIDINSKAGQGLAKRATKKGMKLKSKRKRIENFDDVVRAQIIKMKKYFDQIKEIDCKNHKISFYSQATTFDGICSLIELTDDPFFSTFDANELLQILNLVGVACNGKVGEFPDASTWRVNEIFVGCYISVADIVTSKQQSDDSEFVLKVPGTDKEITNVIPVFDDPRIGVFLKKYAPSLLEFTSSIGMRKVIADVPMTFGFTIIAGIRKLMYDLNKNKSTEHVETFAQFINSASSFIGRYFDHIEELLKEKELGMKGFHLANNGIGNMMVPLIRIFVKKELKSMQNYLPEILRAIYSCEIWKGISKEFRSKREFDQIVKEMLHKLLSIDIENKKIKVQEPFVPEPDEESLKFDDSYAVNKEYLNELAQSLYYHNYMTLLPKFIEAVTTGKVEEIKNIPEMTKSTAMEAFGIDYSQNEFIFLNIFQALRYPRSSSRADTKLGEMKIIDVKYKNEIIEDIKNYVRIEFKDLYEFEVKMKKHKEEEILANEIVDKLTKETNYENLLKIWKSEISRGEITFKFSNTHSIAFRFLLKKVIDMKSNIPLRADIIKILLLSVDNDGQIVYNNGKIADVKNLKKVKKRFLITNSNSEWNEIETKIDNQRNEHKYREMKKNRHGHGNEKASYWALGYNNLVEHMSEMTSEEMNEYVYIHDQCCSARNVQTTVWNTKWEKEEKEDEKQNEND